MLGRWLQSVVVDAAGGLGKALGEPELSAMDLLEGARGSFSPVTGITRFRG